MAGPLDTALTALYLTDNVSPVQASTWDDPFHAIANLVDSHLDHSVSGSTGQGGVPIQHHRDVDIVIHADILGGVNRTTAITPDATSLDTILNELVFAWAEMRGVAANTFHSAAAPALTIADLSAATNLTTATSATIPKRDGTGGVQFTYIGVIPRTATSDIALNIVGPTGWTGYYIYGTLNGVQKFSVDTNGNMFLAGSLSVAAALFASLISDYRPVVSATAGHVAISPGGAYPDSGGNQIGPLLTTLDVNVVGTVAQPSGSNAQYVALSAPVGWNGTAATLTLTPGTPGLGTPAKPTVPTGNEAFAMLLWRGPTATAGAGNNGGGVFLASDITDMRYPGGSGGGVGGGTIDAALRAVGLMTYGAPGVAGGGYQMDALQVAAHIHPGNIYKAGDAPSYAVTNNMLQADTLARLGEPSGATVTFAASPTSPWTVNVNGTIRQATAPVSATCTAAANQVVGLYVDVSAPGAQTAVFIPAGGTITASQQWIANYRWNGGSLSQPLPSGNASRSWTSQRSTRPLLSLPSSQVFLDRITVLDNGAAAAAVTPASTTTLTAWAGMTAGQFEVIEPMIGWIDCDVFVQGFTLVSAGIVYMAPLLDGNPALLPALYCYCDPLQVTSTGVKRNWRVHLPNKLLPGTHTLTLAFLTSVASSSSITIAQNGARLDLVGFASAL
jgi:hypothetical protein